MKSRKRVIASLLIFAAVFALGVAGFKIFGGREWSLLDSIYMTVITVATIGYGEVHDLSGNLPARVFSTAYILLSLGTIAFAVTSITAFIVEGELKNLLGRRKMDKEISKLDQHYIVCGGDETAQTIIQEMVSTKKKFVVIEPSKERLDKLAELGDFPFIQEDPLDDDVLLKGGIRRAKGILLSLPSDEANLFAVVTARSLNPSIRIVAKGIDVKSHGKMKRAGADYVVSPTFIGGMRMVSQMIRPAVVTFLDTMLREREEVLRFDEVHVGRESPLIGKTLSHCGLREKSGALLVAIQRGGEKGYIFNPAQATAIQEGDILIFIATPDSIREIEKA